MAARGLEKIPSFAVVSTLGSIMSLVRFTQGLGFTISGRLLAACDLCNENALSTRRPLTPKHSALSAHSCAEARALGCTEH